jgi:hypothetical protein
MVGQANWPAVTASQEFMSDDLELEVLLIRIPFISIILLSIIK